jgi:hypothetical protein
LPRYHVFGCCTCNVYYSVHSSFVSCRPMGPPELLGAGCNKSCTGPAPSKPSGRCQPVFCMTTMDKFSHGASKPRMPAPCLARPDANGVDQFTIVNLFCAHLEYLRFKLFLEPRAIRNEAAADPRLPPIPVRGCLYPSIWYHCSWQQLF